MHFTLFTLLATLCFVMCIICTDMHYALICIICIIMQWCAKCVILFSNVHNIYFMHSTLLDKPWSTYFFTSLQILSKLSHLYNLHQLCVQHLGSELSHEMECEFLLRSNVSSVHVGRSQFVAQIWKQSAANNGCKNIRDQRMCVFIMFLQEMT